MHYPDVVGRMRGSRLVFVPLDDDEFGKLQKTFHLADAALHAVQADACVAIGSTDGPTAIISHYGCVEYLLPYGEDGTLSNWKD